MALKCQKKVECFREAQGERETGACRHYTAFDSVHGVVMRVFVKAMNNGAIFAPRILAQLFK
jgi:hypothetical protein